MANGIEQAVQQQLGSSVPQQQGGVIASPTQNPDEVAKRIGPLADFIAKAEEQIRTDPAARAALLAAAGKMLENLPPGANNSGLARFNRAAIAGTNVLANSRANRDERLAGEEAALLDQAQLDEEARQADLTATGRTEELTSLEGRAGREITSEEKIAGERNLVLESQIRAEKTAAANELLFKKEKETTRIKEDKATVEAKVLQLDREFGQTLSAAHVLNIEAAAKAHTDSNTDEPWRTFLRKWMRDSITPLPVTEGEITKAVNIARQAEGAGKEPGQGALALEVVMDNLGISGEGANQIRIAYEQQVRDLKATSGLPEIVSTTTTISEQAKASRLAADKTENTRRLEIDFNNQLNRLVGTSSTRLGADPITGQIVQGKFEYLIEEGDEGPIAGWSPDRVRKQIADIELLAQQMTDAGLSPTAGKRALMQRQMITLQKQLEKFPEEAAGVQGTIFNPQNTAL